MEKVIFVNLDAIEPKSVFIDCSPFITKIELIEKYADKQIYIFL
jgi:hypothetical protein